ncbi:MAG: hypothetical protein HY779_06220 [Rubrobacteridae bacterium]|nr:hypothetical protein [Rubrobacteridae bacterium]
MSKRLKILFVASWYPNDKKPNSALFVKEHAKAAALYNAVVVMAVGDKDAGVKGFYEVDSRMEDNIKTIRLTHKIFFSSNITAFMSMINSLRYMLKLRKEGFVPDVVHANVFASGVSAVIFGKLTGTKIVVTEHWSGFAR